MDIIGLCGGSGSGKGAVASVMRTLGIPIIDADAVYHDIVSREGECTREISHHFGEEVLTADGALSRAALSEKIFTDADPTSRLAVLNSITHKYVIARMRELAGEYAKSGESLAVYDAPLLFEAGIDKECTYIISVLCDKNIRTERIMARDGISRLEAEGRIAAQHTDEWLASHSDFVIVNEGSESELASAVSEILEKIRK
ncbi:MAG: dephospho-CoA kinase [Clostridia bacterium]|nr:dephospho-CoA kinase [Clostridia bacterium]